MQKAYFKVLTVFFQGLSKKITQLLIYSGANAAIQGNMRYFLRLIDALRTFLGKAHLEC
jgi:hypothetical protein